LVAVGVNINSVDLDCDVEEAGYMAYGAKYDIEVDDTFGFKIGFGADFFVTEKLAANLELGWKYNKGELHDTVGGLTLSEMDFNASSFTFIGGFRYYFSDFMQSGSDTMQGGSDTMQGGSSPASRPKDWSISVGPKLGLNLADVGGDAEGTGMKTAFCGGAFLALEISEWFTFQPEVLYSQKGANIDLTDASISLDYIEIPLLAMLTIPTESRFTPNVFVGPSIAFNIGADVSGYGESVDVKEIISTVDVGIAVGAGVKIGDLGPGAITADIRYTFGLTNVLDLDEYSYVLDIDPDASAKNNVFCFMVGYAF